MDTAKRGRDALGNVREDVFNDTVTHLLEALRGRNIDDVRKAISILQETLEGRDLTLQRELDSLTPP